MNDDSEPGGGSPRLVTGEIIAVSAVSCFPAGSPRSSPEPAVSGSTANRTPKLDLSGLSAVEGTEGFEDLPADNGCVPGGLSAEGAAEGLPCTSLTDTPGDPLSNGDMAGGAKSASSPQEAACLSPTAKKVMIIEQEKARSGTGQPDSPASLPSGGSSRRGSCLRDGRSKRGTGVPEECLPNPRRKSTDPKSDSVGDKAGLVMTVQSETGGSKRVESSIDASRKHSRSSAYHRLSSRNSDSSPRQILRESLSKPRSSKIIGRESPETSRRTPNRTGGKRKSSCSKRPIKSNSRTRTTVGQPGGGAGSEDEAESADEVEGSGIEDNDLEERQAGDEHQTAEKALAAPQETTKNAEPVEIELELGKDDVRNTDDSELRYNMRTGKFSKVVLPKPGLAPRNRSGQEPPGDQSEWIFPWEVRRDIDVFALSASAFDRKQRNSVWDKPRDLPGTGQHSAGHGSPPKTFLKRFHHKEVEDVRHLDDVLKEGKTDFFYECLRKMSEANEWSQLMDMNCVYRAFKSRDGRLACHVYDGKSYIKRLPIEVFLSYEYPRIRRAFTMYCPFLNLQPSRVSEFVETLSPQLDRYIQDTYSGAAAVVTRVDTCSSRIDQPLSLSATQLSSCQLSSEGLLKESCFFPTSAQLSTQNLNEAQTRKKRQTELQDVLLSTFELTRTLREQLQILQQGSPER